MGKVISFQAALQKGQYNRQAADFGYDEPKRSQIGGLTLIQMYSNKQRPDISPRPKQLIVRTSIAPFKVDACRQYIDVTQYLYQFIGRNVIVGLDLFSQPIVAWEIHVPPIVAQSKLIRYVFTPDETELFYLYEDLQLAAESAGARADQAPKLVAVLEV